MVCVMVWSFLPLRHKMELNSGGRSRAPSASACLPRRRLARALQSPALQAVLFPVLNTCCAIEPQRQEIKVRNPEGELISFFGQLGPEVSGCSLCGGNQVLSTGFAGNPQLVPCI